MEALEHDTYLIVSSPAIALVPPHAAAAAPGASGLAYSPLPTIIIIITHILWRYGGDHSRRRNAAATPPKTRVDSVRENQLGFLKWINYKNSCLGYKGCPISQQPSSSSLRTFYDAMAAIIAAA